MSVPRRFYPPTALLRAFEAAARTQSVTAAARELDLTQSAVSRQIRALEAMLGAELFHREKQKIRLTLAGAAYGREIREALARISSATLGFRANPSRGSLHLAVPPLFGARWLAPRLPAFLAQRPDIVVNLATRTAPFDFRADTLDAAIHDGPPDWPGAEAVPLMAESLVAVCAPALKARLGLATPADLATAPLVHLATRPDAWEAWFAAMEVDAGEVRGMLVDQLTLGLELARAGAGAALLPSSLIVPELESGALVRAAPSPPLGVGRYHFFSPQLRDPPPPVEAFLAWLMAEVEEAAAPGA